MPYPYLNSDKLKTKMLKSKEIRAKVCVGLKLEALNNLENKNRTLLPIKKIFSGLL